MTIAQIISIAIILFAIELLYFQIADHFNIVDQPNQRSSHTKTTLRGGGIIFAISLLIYFIISKGGLPYLALGTLLIAAVSFWDDLKTLSNRIRVSVHLIAVSLLFYQAFLLGIFFPWYLYFLLYILVIGIINAVNFMDGINGITVAYGIVLIGTLLYANHTINFIDNQLLIFILLGLLVFAFFNFRTKAKCFAGDVGSISFAFISCYLLLMLMQYTHNYIYILFLAIYGIDTIFTILIRLKRKENIFEAHRLHLYQLLSNELKLPHLYVSSLYAAMQIIINLIVLFIGLKLKTDKQIMASVILLFVLTISYLVLRSWINSKITAHSRHHVNKKS